jgi:hypothetical protein
MAERLQAFDHLWYPEFSAVGSFEVYEYLGDDVGKRRNEMNAFFAAGHGNPHLEYPKIDINVVRQKEQVLVDLKSNILTHESNINVQNVYRWKINEKIAELRLLKAAVDGDMRRFKKYSEFLYGTPPTELFGYTINAVRAKALRLAGSEDHKIAEAAENLLTVLPEEFAFAKPLELPSEHVVERVQSASLELLGNSGMVEGTELLNSNQVVEYFSQALQEAQIQGWTVVEDPQKKGISVSQESKQIKVATERKVSPEKLRKLILHELRTHAERRTNGERSRLLLLGLGLDRYEGGEEGVATMREQGLDDTVESYRGWEGMLAIGLAYGLDGKPRDFRQVFEIMKKYFELDQYEPYTPGGEVKSPAEFAWDRCLRTFKGTTCDEPGVCFPKDIIYQQGNVGVWQLMGSNPDEMLRFQVGKYDPTNSRHLQVLETFGITDNDLLT